MASNQDFLAPRYAERPIVLSPPPVEPSSVTFQQIVDERSGTTYHLQRNQSVGYNLQQEFEALKADLDLDLSQSNDGADELSSQSSGATHGANGLGSRVLSGGPSLLSPASNSAYGMAPSLLENLLRDSAISPAAGTASALPSLLINKGSGFLPPLNSVPSRPQLVNDFSSFRQMNQFLRLQQPSSFYPDMLAFTSWLENLNPQEMVSMLDYWCNNMPFDILLTMKSKLDAHLQLGVQQPNVFSKVSTYPQYQSSDYVGEMDSLSLDDSLNQQSLLNLAQPKPKTNTFQNHLFSDPKVQRPKLADPTLHNRNAQAQAQLERLRSPTSHLYEKTNFLQLAAASSNTQHSANSHHYSQPLHGSSEDGLDLSAASKLGALATINLRVALDSSRKNFQPSRAAAYEESINRMANSSSVPANTQKYSVAALLGLAASQKGKKDPESPLAKKTVLSPTSSASAAAAAAASSSMPLEIASPELLSNIPAWLKLLRLHKYTDCLKDMYWMDLIQLDDQMLEDKGVKALGARRKLLKAFEAVRRANA